MKNTQSKRKSIKTGKKIGTIYCLGCKDYTHNFKPQEIEMKNKVLRGKSNCVICRSSKTRFLKQKHNKKGNFNDNIHHQIVFTNFKTCICIVKTVKEHEDMMNLL